MAIVVDEAEARIKRAKARGLEQIIACYENARDAMNAIVTRMRGREAMS